ncbi:hypothetical protein F5Y12DRAFT_357181 [Xylaria sp. FL1777]|nr:hypothetical protein F5Y12DRAFT_357181 [Xylaria sp. FL1777]
MLSPFICQKCTARLARCSFRLLRSSNSPLHTRVVPAERPSDVVVLPTKHRRGWDPESSHSRLPSPIVKGNGSEGSTAPLPSPASSQEQDAEDDGAADSTVAWTGAVWKMVPRRTPTVKQLATQPLANTARELKSKVLGARGDYVLVHRDLAALYGLSRQEARYAVGQLERLLWGHQAMEVAARRLDQYLAWKKDFAAVLRNVVSASPIQGDTPGTSDANSEMASHVSDPASMRTAWQRLDGDRRERLWPQIVLSLADSEPHILRSLIESTFDPSWCPSYVVEDIVYLLFRRHLLMLQRGAHDDGSRMLQEITAIVTFVLNKCPPRYLALEQVVLRSTLASLSNSELVQRYKLLKTIEHPLHANTLLHLASRFAKAYDTKLLAVDIIRALTAMWGFDINSPAAASACTSLLTLNEHEPLPDEQAAPDLLFEFLIKQGFAPNLLGMTAIMRNFCIRGHLDTAWKIFDLMLQHGLGPDHHVYSTLLNGSKRNLDSASFEHIFNIISSRNAWSSVLLNDFLALLFEDNESQVERRRRQRKQANNAWRPMLELYAKFYRLAPLQKFVLFPLENLVGTTMVQPKYATPVTRLAESLMPQPDHRLISPDSYTLCLMIGAHMRSLNTPKYAIRTYICFSNLVKNRESTALGLLANHGTLVFDTFLRTFLQFEETIGLAIDEVRKCIYAAEQAKTEDGYKLHYRPPSLRTWTILLNGLKNHNDTRGVVAIFDMMSNIGGVQPTLAAWNILTQAFALTRNVDGVVKAISSLEKAGFQSDNRTLKAVNILPESMREKVITQLEEIRKARKDGVSKSSETHQISSNDPIQRPRPFVPKTLEALAAQYERLDKQKIDSRSKKRKLFRLKKRYIP